MPRSYIQRVNLSTCHVVPCHVTCQLSQRGCHVIRHIPSRTLYILYSCPCPKPMSLLNMQQPTEQCLHRLTPVDPRLPPDTNLLPPNLLPPNLPPQNVHEGYLPPFTNQRFPNRCRNT